MVTTAKKTISKSADVKKTAAPAATVKTAGKSGVKPDVKKIAATAVKPAVNSGEVKPAVKSAVAPKTKLKVSTAPQPVLTTEQRNHYVSVAAFYIAERRGFTLGNPEQDWLAAEAEVDRLIASGHFTV